MTVFAESSAESSSFVKEHVVKVGKPVYQIVIGQFIATFLVAALCLFVDWVAAYSAFLGGLTCAVPSAFMAWRMGRRVLRSPLTASHLVRGELGKLGITLFMFSMVFYWIESLKVGFFFAALVFGLLCNVFVPLLADYQQEDRRHD